MANVRTFVGLDAHASQTQAATLDRETGELRFRRVNGPSRDALSYLESLAAPVIATYEAGPVGYGLARAAAKSEVEVRVCAPGSVPRKANQRIKTDRRDAERLARLLTAGELTFVRVPTVEEERFRDLARCREAARGDLMRPATASRASSPGASFASVAREPHGRAPIATGCAGSSSTTRPRARCSPTTWRR